MRLRGCLVILLTLPLLSAFDAQTGDTSPVLRYETPTGFSRGTADAQTWIADRLDGVIHVYPFEPFHGDLVREFQRTLFRDRISALYREDKRLNQPTFRPLNVKGATTAVAAAFKNFNGGAQRQHLRVAILATGHVALVDMSANSPRGFERNQPAFSSLLNSLHVVEGDPSTARVPRN